MTDEESGIVREKTKETRQIIDSMKAKVSKAVPQGGAGQEDGGEAISDENEGEEVSE